MEAEAVLGILSPCNTVGFIELVLSEALVYEIEQNPLPIRQEHGYSVLAKAKTTINVTADVQEEHLNFWSTMSGLLMRFIWLWRKQAGLITSAPVTTS